MPKVRKIYFGGSFYPPHCAHTEMIKNALKQDTRAQLVIIPTKQNPLKESPGASSELIQAWLEDLHNELGDDFHRCHLNPLEMNSSSDANYTSETLNKIKGNDNWVLLLGSDSALSFHQWKNPESILSMIEEIWIVPRGNFDNQKDSQIISNLFKQKKIIYLPKAPDISSTELRNEATSQFQDLKAFLGPSVLKVWKKLHSPL